MKRKEIAACPEFDFLIPCSSPSRATRPPLPVQPLDHPREREPVPFLKGPFSDAVVCARRLPVAVRTERHARVVGRLLAHTAVPPGMSGFAPAFHPAGDAGHFTDPRQVRLVARRSLARGRGGAALRLAAVDRPGEVRAELVFGEHDLSGELAAGRDPLPEWKV